MWRGHYSPVHTVPENEVGSPSGLPDSSCPLRRFQVGGSVSGIASPRCRRPLMRLGCSSECYGYRSTEPIGLARTRLDLAVSSWPSRDFLVIPAPGHLRFRVHPLVSFASSPEFVPANYLPDGRNRRAPSMGLRHLLSDISTGSPLHDGRPTSRLRSALSVSRTLDGLLLLVPCRLVSSGRHFRDSLYRGFPRHSADLTHRQLVLS